MRTFLILSLLFSSLCSLRAQSPAYADYAIKGVDVSKWNKEVDWSQVVGQGYTFAIVRATQGKKVRDPLYKTHWKGAQAAGMVCGSYHFFVTTRSGKQQARRFMRRAKKWEPGTVPPVLDVERMDGGSSEEMREEISQWMAMVEKRWKVRPIIYSNENFYKEHLQGFFEEYPVWIARFRKAGPETKDWTLWQYTDKGELKGVEGPIDLNVFYGNPVEFESLINTGLNF